LSRQHYFPWRIEKLTSSAISTVYQTLKFHYSSVYKRTIKILGVTFTNSKSAQPVPKAVYRDKHGAIQILVLTPQSDALTTRLLRPETEIDAQCEKLAKLVGRTSTVASTVNLVDRQRSPVYHFELSLLSN